MTCVATLVAVLGALVMLFSVCRMASTTSAPAPAAVAVGWPKLSAYNPAEGKAIRIDGKYVLSVSGVGFYSWSSSHLGV